MTIYWGILFTLLGLAVGSFLNVLADRLPNKQSIVAPPSHCPECNKRIRVFDLIPVISYVVLRGRCRYCSQPIPKRTLLVEIAAGLMFLSLYLYFGLSPDLGIALLYFTLLLLILVIDLEHRLILNVIVYPAAVIVLLVNIVFPSPELVPGFLNSLAGGGTGLLLFLLILIVSRGGMGLGDVKMAGLLGLMLGLPLNFVAIFLAVVSGGLIAGASLLFKRKNRRQAIAFGPFLAIGTMAAILWGQLILDWYLGFFAF